ncbi:MAG: hypothetical protein ACLRM8_02975 [Alistipes sp.]
MIEMGEPVAEVPWATSVGLIADGSYAAFGSDGTVKVSFSRRSVFRRQHDGGYFLRRSAALQFEREDRGDAVKIELYGIPFRRFARIGVVVGDGVGGHDVEFAVVFVTVLGAQGAERNRYGRAGNGGVSVVRVEGAVRPSAFGAGERACKSLAVCGVRKLQELREVIGEDAEFVFAVPCAGKAGFEIDVDVGAALFAGSDIGENRRQLLRRRMLRELPRRCCTRRGEALRSALKERLVFHGCRFFIRFRPNKNRRSSSGADSVGGRDVSGRGKSFFRGDLNRLDHRGGVLPPFVVDTISMVCNSLKWYAIV